MNKSLLAILGVVAGALVAAALFIDRPGSLPAPTDQAVENLAAGLAERIPQVARIEMRNADGEVTLVKNPEGNWTIEQSGGYRANDSQVRQLLAGIATMEVRQRLTSNAALLPELGLGEPGAEGTRATLVTLKDASGAGISSLVFGNTKFGAMPGAGQSVYMRRADENQAWEVRSSASPSTTLSSWRPREIANVATNRVRRMEVSIADDVAFEMERPESPEDSFNITSKTDGWRVRETVTGDRSVAGFLQSLTLQDVRPAVGFFDTLGESSRLLTQTFDGLEVESHLRKQDDKTFMTLSARFNEALRDYADSLPEPEADSTPTLKSAEEVQAEVAEINSLTAGWAYELPTWKFSGIERSARTTILEEIAKDVHAAQILIAWEGAPQSAVIGRTQEQALELAESLRQRIEDEGDEIFADLAREYSDDAATAEEGGTIGVVTRSDMTPEFTDALFELEEGQVSEVVETDFGYVLIKRTAAP